MAILLDPRTKTVKTNDKLGRLPQPKDRKGVLTACTVISLWSLLFYHCHYQIKLVGEQRCHVAHVLAAFVALEYLYTGLFITTHDAMHGSISFRNRWLNDFIGRLAITLYAWFDYGMLHKNHWEHHDHTGLTNADPDFHGGNPNMWVWFIKFMMHYLSLGQVVRITICGMFLQATGVPMINLAVFQAGAGLLSSFRLFYFGTYLPHLPERADEVMNWEKSHTSDDPRWLSMLKCYHFDYHWEHHRWPYAPWWQLPAYRQLVKQQAAVPCQG